MSVTETTNHEFDSELTAEDFKIGDEISHQESQASTEETGSTVEDESQSTESASTDSAHTAEDSGESSTADGANTQSAVNETSQEGSKAPGESSSGTEGDLMSMEEADHFVKQFSGHESYDELAQELHDLREFKANAGSEGETTENQYEGLSEFSLKLIEYELNGGNPLTFAKTQSIDVDGMSDHQAMKEQFFMKNPDFDRAKAEKIFESKFQKNYGTDEDTMSEEEIDLAKTQLELDASQARKAIKEQQVSATDLPHIEKEDPAEVEARNAEVERVYNDHVSQVNNLMEDFTGFNIPMDENGTKLSIAPSDEVKEKVNQWLQNPYTDESDPSFSETVVQDIFVSDSDPNQLDYDKAAFKLTMLADPKAFLDNAYKLGMEKGKEALITKRANPSSPRTENAPQGNGQQSLMEEVGEALAKARGN